MKTLLAATIFMVTPLLVFAQGYEIPLSDVENKQIKKYNTKNLDLSVTEWEKNAKIIFTGLDTGDEERIEVKNHNDNMRIIVPDPNVAEGKAIYDVSKAIKNDKEFAFDVFFKGEPAGTVVFNIKRQDAGNDRDEETDEVEETDNEPDGANDFESYLGALASANFIGNNEFLANLTPIVNLGGVVPLYEKSEDPFSWEIDVNPYLGGKIDTRDSVSYIPALMLHGGSGVILNNYFNIKLNKTTLTLMPVGFGLKLLPNLQDTSNTVTQHNIRIGAGIKYSNFVVLSAQFTYGWHNLTAQSEENFHKVFSREATDIKYLTVIGQFALRGQSSDVTNYIFFEWRSLLNSSDYQSFNNNRILTLGIRKTLELRGTYAFPAGTTNKQLQQRPRKIRYML